MIKTDPSSIYQEFQDFVKYRQSLTLDSKWTEAIRFREGNQWPPPTEATKYMPRPVINQCDFTIDNKLSNILSQSIKMIYSPEEMPIGQDTTDLVNMADDYTAAAANTWHDIDQDELNEDAVTDCLTLGSAIYHYYFDNNQKGGMFTKYIGKIQGEIIDPMDIALGNPQLKPSKTQSQPYIIVRRERDTDELIERSKKNGKDWQNIQPDQPNTKNDSGYDSEKKNLEGIRKTTEYIKYYKQNGQVYWTEVTETAVIQKSRPLSPQPIEVEGQIIQSKPFELYPIEIMVFKKRHKCVFGRGILDDMIPAQKALNYGIGMMLLSVQQTAWPKILAKVGALVQTITNEPGEILVDNFNNPGVDGIKFMQPPNFSQMPMLLTEKLLDMTRQVTGTTEVTSGEVIGANMAASAIIALQNQAKKPNEAFQNKLFRSQKNIGRIWEEFYKCHYNMPRPISTTDKDGKDITKVFTGSSAAEMSFGLKIDIGPASLFNEALQMSVIDKMADRQWIDKYQYAKYSPSNVLPQDLKHDFETEYEQIKDQQLTPEDLAELQANPQLLNQAIAKMGGGNGAV